MKYIIDKELVLDVDNNIISNFHDNEKILYISIISTRLFSEILKHPSGVTRSYLLEKVWSEHGLTPSSNNLNNHMSVLRKAIFSVTGTEDYIITLPKKGFVFNKKYSIEIPTKNETAEIKKNSTEGVKNVNFFVILPYLTTLIFAFLFILTSDSTSSYLIGDDTFYKYNLCNFKPIKKVPAHQKNHAISVVKNAIKFNEIKCDTDSYDIYFYLNNNGVNDFNLFSFCKNDSNGDYSHCKNTKAV